MIDPNTTPQRENTDPLGYSARRDTTLPRPGGARTLVIVALAVVGLLLLIALFTAGGGEPTDTAPAALEGTEAPAGAAAPEADPAAPATGTPGATPEDG